MRFEDDLKHAKNRMKRVKNYLLFFVVVFIIIISYHHFTSTMTTTAQSLGINQKFDIPLFLRKLNPESKSHQQSFNAHKDYSSFNLTSQLVAGKPKTLPLQGKTIVIDPGHGGKDQGTTGINGIDEKILTLKTALVVAKKLKDAGATVILTRKKDHFITLTKRVIIAEENHADAFISMHYNFSTIPSIKGMTGFYYHKQKDYQLAYSILTNVVRETGFKDRGVRYDDLHVLRENSQPATLIELGFLSNQHDDPIVTKAAYRDKVANGVYQGLIDYFNSQPSNQKKN